MIRPTARRREVAGRIPFRAAHRTADHRRFEPLGASDGRRAAPRDGPTA
jgi:hypothetical protein